MPEHYSWGYSSVHFAENDDARNEELTGIIVDTAYRLHTRLGPGLLESVYETVFAKMLQDRGLNVERRWSVPLEFEGLKFDEVHRVDLLVEKQVVVELKAAEALLPVHTRQVLTYLCILDLPVGLLINFGAAKLNQGLKRVLNPHASAFTTDRLDEAG